MPDIATAWDVGEGRGDWVLQAPDIELWVDEDGNSIVDEDGNPVSGALEAFTPGYGLVQGADLVTAVLISLFSDAEASPDDPIPDGSTDPRGWWGDLEQDVKVGSRLWLRVRAKQEPKLLQTVQDDIQDALRWMIDDGVVAAIDVITTFPRTGMIGSVVTLHRTNGTTLTLRFQWAWQELS